MREVCGGFAAFSVGVVATAGMAAPAFHYPETEARRMVERFVRHPVRCALNPFWWPGFVLARWFLGRHWPDLRLRIERMRGEAHA